MNEGEVNGLTMNQISVIGTECNLDVNEGGQESEDDEDYRVVNPIVAN